MKAYNYMFSCLVCWTAYEKLIGLFWQTVKLRQLLQSWYRRQIFNTQYSWGSVVSAKEMNSANTLNSISNLRSWHYHHLHYLQLFWSLYCVINEIVNGTAAFYLSGHESSIPPIRDGASPGMKLPGMEPLMAEVPQRQLKTQRRRVPPPSKVSFSDIH